MDAWQLYNDVWAMTHPSACWNLMLEFPKTEDEVQKAFMYIMWNLKMHWSGGDNRDVIDTHKNCITDSHNSSSFQPDMFFTGSITLSIQSPHWLSCIVATEVKTRKEKLGPDPFGLLGTYAEHIFSAQENWRFISSLFVDEWNICFFIFDWGGAI